MKKVSIAKIEAIVCFPPNELGFQRDFGTTNGLRKHILRNHPETDLAQGIGGQPEQKKSRRAIRECCHSFESARTDLIGAVWYRPLLAAYDARHNPHTGQSPTPTVRGVEEESDLDQESDGEDVPHILTQSTSVFDPADMSGQIDVLLYGLGA